MNIWNDRDGMESFRNKNKNKKHTCKTHLIRNTMIS